MELTKEQKSAIAKLKRALKEAEKVGIRICGMDDTLYYANIESIGEAVLTGNYCPVAEANEQLNDNGVGTIVTRGIYQDSGGW